MTSRKLQIFRFVLMEMLSPQSNTAKKQLFEKPDRESRKRHQTNEMEGFFLRPQ